MLLKDLDAKHPTYDADAWADNDALYAGGKKFRDRIHRFLPQNPMEPDAVYAQRKNEARYRPYVGSIVDYYVAWLFSATFDIRAKGEDGEATELDSFYAQWKEEVAEDTDLIDFMRARMTSALVAGAAHWLVEFPDDGQPRETDKADFNARKLGEARLRQIERSEVYDWECDDAGALVWVNVHDLKTTRADPRAGARSTFVETWKIYDATDCETFRVTYQKGKRPKPTEEIPSLGKRPHGLARVPMVVMAPPAGLEFLERLKDAQLENFSLIAAHNWSIKRTCYAMPVFQVENSSKPPTMGAGYYIMIGKDEKASWIAPPTEHLQITGETIESSREELYRLTHQLALSVNNKKAAAVSRSGESKEQDSLSTRVMLNALGAVAKEAIEQTFDLVSEGRLENLSFSIEGLDAFDTEAVSALLANGLQAEKLGLFGKSKTWDKEMTIRAQLGMVPDVDQVVKDAIRKETEDAVDKQPDVDQAEQVRQALAGLAQGGAAPGNGGGTPSGQVRPPGNSGGPAQRKDLVSGAAPV